MNPSNQTITSEHRCAVFTRWLLLAAQTQLNLSGDEEFDSNSLTSLLDSNPTQDSSACLLTHDLWEETDCPATPTFDGTLEGFEMMTSDLSESTTESISFVHNPNLLELFCNICLDNGLYPCALNLALQLHNLSKLSETKEEEEEKEPVSTAPSCLSPALWKRVVQLCSSHSPSLMTSPTVANNGAELNSQTVSGVKESVDYAPQKVPSEYAAPNIDSSSLQLSSTNNCSLDQSPNDDYLYAESYVDVLNSQLPILSDAGVVTDSDFPESDSSTELNGDEDFCDQPVIDHCVSILKTPGRSQSLDSAIMSNTPMRRKRVRFSLHSAHPSPEMEAEFGGRSNRRRLIDFTRRRQMVGGGGEVTTAFYNPWFFILTNNSNYPYLDFYSLVKWLFRSFIYFTLISIVLLLVLLLPAILLNCHVQVDSSPPHPLMFAAAAFYPLSLFADNSTVHLFCSNYYLPWISHYL